MPAPTPAPRTLGRLAALAAILLAAGVAAAISPAGDYDWRLPPGVAPPPVPADNPMSAIKVELGRHLFYDADLSIDGTMSCATCHEQKHAFTDTNATRPGVLGDPGRRNIMGLANVGYFTSLTWGDAGMTTLEHQALTPIEGADPVEMGMTAGSNVLAQRIAGNTCYRKMFARAFPQTRGAVSMTTITQALAAFERTLVSFDAPYDRAHRGGPALPDDAQRGEALFRGDQFQCATCHSGELFTDAALSPPTTAFHVAAPFDPADPGLARVTGLPADAGKIRTPSLRNVALTSPHFHDGAAVSMTGAIRMHFTDDDAGTLAAANRDARLKRAPPSAAETADLLAFLMTLTDTDFVTDKRFALPPMGCPVR